MHTPFEQFSSGYPGALSGAKCYSGLCTLVAHGRWGHLRCRTYIGAGSSAEEEAVALEQTEDPPLFGESFSQKKKKKRGGKKFCGRRKALFRLPVVPNFGLTLKKLTLETMADVQLSPLSRQRKGMVRFDGRVAYKYPQAR